MQGGAKPHPPFCCHLKLGYPRVHNTLVCCCTQEGPTFLAPPLETCPVGGSLDLSPQIAGVNTYKHALCYTLPTWKCSEAARRQNGLQWLPGGEINATGGDPNDDVLRAFTQCRVALASTPGMAQGPFLCSEFCTPSVLHADNRLTQIEGNDGQVDACVCEMGIAVGSNDMTVSYASALNLVHGGGSSVTETRRVHARAGRVGAPQLLAFEAGRLCVGCEEGDRVIVFSDSTTLRAELEPFGVRFVSPELHLAHERWWQDRERGLLDGSTMVEEMAAIAASGLLEDAETERRDAPLALPPQESADPFAYLESLQYDTPAPEPKAKAVVFSSELEIEHRDPTAPDEPLPEPLFMTHANALDNEDTSSELYDDDETAGAAADRPTAEEEEVSRVAKEAIIKEKVREYQEELRARIVG